VYLLALAVLFAACDTGTGGDGSSPGPDTITNDPVTYSNASENIELKIARTEAELSKAAITPQNNDWYILKHKGVEISRGTITVSGTGWTFKVSAGGKVTSDFSATLSGETLTFSVAISYQGTRGTVTIAANTPLTGATGSNYDDGWTVTTIAGGVLDGSADGTGTDARFRGPSGIAIDSVGNLYVADSVNNSIRKITLGGVVTTFAGSTSSGWDYADGTGTGARFRSPGGITIDSAGNLYVADTYNHNIRKITPGGVVTTIAGIIGGDEDDGGYANGMDANARFERPKGITIDSAGNLYVADSGNNNIRKITPEGVVTTFVGSTSGGYGGEGYADGTGADARFNHPEGITIDSAGNLYVTDSGNNNIRKITPAGVVTTFAGSTSGGFTSSGYTDGTGTDARFGGLSDITIDSAGNLYVADTGNKIIRKITAGGVVTTIVGDFGNHGFGSYAWFGSPSGITIDSAGNLYVTDSINHNIRKLTPPAGN
jgi:sugar lactone lactonase YvrE